jgi:O-antigen/teichoic acid export membrane protein
VTRPRIEKSLTVNAVSLMTATIVTNALGLVFWAEAAHLRSAAVVGRAAAAVAALTLLATISQLNLTSVFVRLLPTAGRLSLRFVSRGYVAVVAVALVVGAVYTLSGLSAHVITGGVLAHAAFVAAVVVVAIFALQDAVLIGLRLAPWVTIENVSFAAAKLTLLPLMVLLGTGGAIALAWVIPAAVAVVAVSLLLFLRVLPRLGDLEGTLPGRRRLLSFVGGEYLGGLAVTATVQLMPLMVIWRLGATQVAYFTLPWLISMGITALLWNVSSSFVVELIGGRGQSEALLRRSLILWGAIVLGALSVCTLAAGPVLSLAGAPYARHGAELLRLIGLSTPFSAITAIYATQAWLDQRVWKLAGFQTACGVSMLGIALALLNHHVGLAAVGWANLGTQAVAATVAGVLMARRQMARTRLAEAL